MNILILEDVDDDAELIAHKLRETGFKFEWVLAKNKAQYLDLIQTDIDLVLADFTLPNFNALDALAILQVRKPDVPLIIITGSISEMQAMECVRQGVADYLFKDRLGRLGTAVTRVMRERRLALARRQVEADRVQLQDAQTQFIQNVSHELRTPLSLILGHAAMMASSDASLSLGPLTGYQKEALGVILGRTRQLSKLVDDIMIVMELDQGKMGESASEDEVVSLSETVSHSVDEFDPIIRAKGLKLAHAIQPDIIVRGNARFAKSMVDNLLSNAIKFTHKGGITVTLQKRANEIILGVQDTGIGMSQADISKVFCRFCQANGSTARKYGGTGLGLSVAEEVAHSLGGTIEVESEPKRGALFRVRIPEETV